MQISKRPGFSFGEALISISILGLIAVIAIFDLRATRMKDELRTAERLVASDLRSAQARALSAQNLKFCPTAVGEWISCEQSTTDCAGACDPYPPAAIGLRLTEDSASYVFFAKRDLTDNLRMENGEAFLTREFARNGAPNVKVSSVVGVAALPNADVAFQRQNGSMRINACPTCLEEQNLTITLKHSVSDETKTVSLNSLTGRISVE
ncbi:MAG: hypothetical protein WC641_05420 [Patescibacteria group bacterium]